jgi:hypothetical protein
MTRKEKTQQNRFDTKIAPIIKELTKLCKKFNMPMLTSVQLFENEENGARVITQVTNTEEMSLPMTLSTSLMNGTTQVRITDNVLQLAMPKGSMPDGLKQFDNAYEGVDSDIELTEDDFEPLRDHASHCEDCAILMQEAIEAGENVDNIVVPKHDDVRLRDLLNEMKNNKLPFIMPKNDIIH